ncbi:DUF3099 domain-containing protein [Microbacterium caowuchunii]|uniref:DUF3099 domain-containing protein n=1 Tax=Microbacterium caowuchunii TaxID=2614638 RepID=UPI0012455B13|nr:DUF3099 domain-containing protein [Microbacterium caowuchunii]QEV99937.1 DUF3099 domain-containing protein [Microbacterium caowuchunii]
MKKPSPPQSATSLPRAPRDDSGARLAKYMTMMGIRIACFVAMVLITPYGWYTWIFASGAVFLPYLAVVVANVGQDGRSSRAQRPERMLETGPPAPAEPRPAPPEQPRVIRLEESPPREPEA